MAAVCNGTAIGIPEPLEDYTKIGTLPPPAKSVKVSGTPAMIGLVPMPLPRLCVTLKNVGVAWGRDS